jgi:16S rRNA processing protein RimM
MGKLYIGKIIKTKGLDGTLKINSSTDFAPKRYQQGNKIYLENMHTKEVTTLSVVSYYSDKGFDFVKFAEINSLDEANALIGSSLFVNKDELPPLDNDEYYFDDLVACSIIDQNNQNIGKVVNVEDYNGRRSLRIALTNKKELLLPFNKVFVKDVNIASKSINVSLIDGMIE